ncbi:ATP-binding protein [Sporomusa malonica]|uniref:Circadian input-output histidine kinase CikA n=1 Tax=Sporomusa malonica TaxID=112901 RepID=A0A1W2DDR0_9FIRM|nr:ATP-binding protein [Sporomusa malonica]SMC95611.1 Signal transduction histidine kinase [Sporomusa malonica]
MRQYQRWLVAITVVVLTTGWLGAGLAVKVAEDELRSKLLLRTATAAAIVNQERVGRLTATPADTGTADYEYLRQQLTAARSLNPDCRFVYLLKMVNGQVVFLMDSEPETSTDYSPPGSPYNAASEALRHIFLGSKPFVEGPLADEWGVWVSGIAAVRDPADGRVIAVLGMDIDAREWQSGVQNARLIVFGVTAAVLSVIFIVFYALHISAVAARKVYLAEKQAKETAESMSQAKSQFLAYLSHEVRTPVTGILGLGELLESTRLDGQQRDYVRAIAYSARSLLTVLNDVLDFSKIQAGKMTVESVNFEFWKVLTGVNTILQATAANKGISLTITIDPAIPLVVCGDPVRLQQVLLNIAGNAIKFTDAGGVDIKAECLRLDETAVNVKVTVRDTGIGLTQDEINKLFQPFAQTEGANTRKYLGSGLGLSISSSLIKIMGGEFGVDSAKGIGSSFWFTVTLQTAQGNDVINDIMLPDARNEANLLPRWASEPVDRAPDRAGDVLIVEDNSVNQQVFKLQLKHLGLTADLAATGQEAVLMAAKANYKLILMDCGLPLMDGFATTQAIREYESLTGRHTPIIALTANSLAGDREKCLAAGMDDYLAKPVSGKELRHIIERWLTLESEDGIDRVVLGQLKELADSGQADISLFIDAFLEELPLLMAKLKQAVLQEDTRQVSDAAHGLKSMSATIGAKRLAELFSHLEQQAQRGKMEAAKALMAKVEDECRQVGSALKNAASRL